MNAKYWLRASVVLLAVGFNALSVKAQQKPNIIFILTDDLGYGDIGVFFQNQRKASGDHSQPYELTPNLDKMALSGARFTQQYANAPVCAPSRASLITGLNQGNASVRDNQFDKMLENNYTVASMLKTAGYSTTAIGKWGLQGVKEEGPDWPAHPLKRGFDKYYGYMRHSDGHEHYPLEGLYRGKKQVWDNYKEVSAGLSKCYTADLWTAAAKKWIIDHKNGKEAAKPFFMYLAYDTPHAVIELPTQAYPVGGGLKGGLRWLGDAGHMINTASGTIDSYMYPEYANATYDDDHNPATPEVPWPDTYKRYATAVRRIDDAVGDIRQLLSDLNIADNTLVIFTSDNGPSIESYLPADFVPNHPTFFGSYGPFDGIKRDCWEGGLRMPTIAAWPKHIKAGEVVNTPSMLSDWMPTLADAAHIPAPARTDGVSLLPCLTGTGKQKQGLVYVEYFEGGKTPDFKEFEPGRRGRKRNQMQAIRMGDLVGVRYAIKTADDDFEIYNAVNDPKEISNLASKPGYAKIQEAMKAKVLQVRHADAEAPRPYDTVPVPADKVEGRLLPGLFWEYYAGKFPWVAKTDGLTANSTGTSKNITGNEAGHKPGMVCYHGFIKIPADGHYTFSLQVSGKAYLRLHEATLIDADFGYQPGTVLTQTVNLKEGAHAIALYYLLPESGMPKVTLKCTDQNRIDISGKNLVFFSH
ncbi:Arylsulfatase A [Mucilaginibacter lappiensis]|uniref:Arylsulfatase A-like enzyme n=1 Tax=Mucilaginibacter lappiensis TaxID=354630 RepID=A0ABR6PEX2_9SPHI|nr:sulfatase-like hydrolase/transferase [Mucilaginibacter lappiensis]MBB6108320.1 arylsulfatase A-like enzyme [Mucilaginibacter lappiensis]SIQ42489.1 Arylsulfatase A [Mucilaginibacter lappiensis]